MDSTAPTLQRSGSKMPHVPSFNDFCSFVDPSELAPAAPTAPLKIPGSMAPVNTSKMMARSWSMESDDYTPRSVRTPSSFTQTFSRALYEHMRTN